LVIGIAGEFVSVSRRISELEIKYASLELVARKALAEMQGITTELKVLRAGVAEHGDLAAYPKRTDAILAVLRSSNRSLTPSEVTSLLNAGGRTNDDLKVVTTTMSYLRQRGQVEKVGGSYFAA
jgi:hypothetical protein